jgi:hypothetical protein
MGKCKYECEYKHRQRHKNEHNRVQEHKIEYLVGSAGAPSCHILHSAPQDTFKNVWLTPLKVLVVCSGGCYDSSGLYPESTLIVFPTGLNVYRGHVVTRAFSQSSDTRHICHLARNSLMAENAGEQGDLAQHSSVWAALKEEVALHEHEALK